MNLNAELKRLVINDYFEPTLLETNQRLLKPSTL